MNADTMRLLIAKGLTAADLLEVAETLEAPKARTTGAVRQARYRARLKASDVTGDVTGDASLEPQKKVPPDPLKENSPPVSANADTAPKGARRRLVFAKPEDVDEPVWRDFLVLRNRQKAPVTETAVCRIRIEAGSAGWTLNEALTECVARSWRGFKADWVQAKAAPPHKIDPDAGRAFDRLQRGEISFEEFDRTRRKTATGPPRPIGEIVAGLG